MLFRLICLTLFATFAVLAQGDVLSLSQGTATSPGTVLLNVSLQSSSGQEPAGVQFTVSYSPVDFTAIQVTPGPSAITAGKAVSCFGTSTAYNCIVVGGKSTIPDGVLAVVSLTVSPTTLDTTSLVQLQDAVAASTAATTIPISATGTAATIKTTPGVSASTENLQFIYVIGGTTPSGRQIQIANSGAGTLSWNATWKAPWLNVAPASGTTPETITVTVTPAGLAASTYTDTIQIAGTGATDSQAAITVTLVVQATAGASLFVPVFPCRVADTRKADGPLGGPSITGGSSREFIIPDSPCGIPGSASAYSLNVAVVPKHTLNFLTVWPTGQTQPQVSTLNSPDGRIKSNAAIVVAGTSGAISVFATETTDVILDINGYTSDASNIAGLAFYPLTPCRIADTRGPEKGLLGGPSLAAQNQRAFPIDGGVCGMPDGAEAYSLNFAAVPKGPLGYLTAWPAGQEQPVVASLNAVTGTVTANAVIVPSGANGDIDVFATNTTDLVIDTNGYFAAPAPGGLSLYTLPPCRVLDTRQNGGAPFSGIKEVVVSGACGVPPTARAFVFNATVVPPGKFGYLSLWAHGEPQPVVATLNAVDGAITSNMAIVPAANGAIDAYASDSTQLILDVFGYFAP